MNMDVIYIRHCQDSNSSPVPSQVWFDSSRPPWLIFRGLVSYLPTKNKVVIPELSMGRMDPRVGSYNFTGFCRVGSTLNTSGFLVFYLLFLGSWIYDSQLTMRDHVTATCRSWFFSVEAAASRQKLIDEWCSQDVGRGVRGRSAWLL